MSTETTTEEVPVISLEPVEINALYQEPENVEALIEKLSAQALAIVPDTSTAKGRGLIKSTAYAVTQMKTKAASVGKKRIAELRRKYETDTEQTRATVKLIEGKLTELAKQVREPLTRWEDEQKKIAARLEQRKKDIERAGIPFDEFGRPLDLEGLQARLATLTEFDPETQDEEDGIAQGKQVLTDTIAAEEKRIAEQRELDRLRKEQEERDRIEGILASISSVSGINDDGELASPDVIQERINRLAEIQSDIPQVKTAISERRFLLEAQRKESVHQQELRQEKLRVDSFNESVAKVEAYLDTEASSADIHHLQAALNRSIELLQPLTEDERATCKGLFAAFDERIKAAEAKEKLAADQQRSDAVFASIKKALECLESSSLNVIGIALQSLEEIPAETDAEFKAIDEARQQISDHQSIVEGKIESDRRAREKQIADKARADAEAKQEAERKAAAEAQAKREADQKHRGKINGEVVADIVTAGLDEEQAKAVVVAIATGKIRHTSIQY